MSHVMASHPLGAETSAQTHTCHSHHGLQGGLLRSPQPHLPPLNQAHQRACPCKLCWSHNSGLQQASSSPSCSKTPTSEINREYPCLPRQGSGFCAGEVANFNEEYRYGFRPLHWPAQKQSHVPAPDRFGTPCHHSDPQYVPRTPQSPYIPQTPQSDGTAMGAASAHKTTPVTSRFSSSSFNQGRGWEQKGQRMEPNSKGSGSHRGLPNQVTLYSWFLTRCSGSSQGVEVSVGGFLTLGTAGTERFETGPIVQRLEKCRLLANDGLEVRLAGLIDDSTTISNGFSLDIVQVFLSGFPYTWNHLLNNEFRAPTPRHPDCQVSGGCGLDGGVETSQLSFEASDQEKRAPSSSQTGVSCDHPDKANIIMEVNVKQTMTADAQAEKEAAATLKNHDAKARPAVENVEKLDVSSSKDYHITSDSNTRPATEGVDTRLATEGVKKLDTSSSKHDHITNLNSTGLAEQEIINVRNTTPEEGPQENSHVEPSRCKAKKRLGRASRTQLHVGSEEDRTAHTQIGSENALLNQSNGSTESVGKLDKQEQKLQLSPRITRSMQKISRQAASTHNTSHNISNGADTSAHCDSLNICEEAHTPTEQCGSHVKSRSGTTPSTVFQERADKAYHRRSGSTLSQNRDNIDGGKSSSMSPCYYTEGVVEMEVPRPESPMNEANPTSKGEGHSINQEEFISEAVQANDNGIADEEGNILASVTRSKECASFKSVEKLTKASQNELNKRESKLLSKSPRQGSKRLGIPPPLPRPRVSVSQRLISAAFGLKTSRSGRLLVPPLAHWCSQGLLRDKDGGIIAISDGSKDMSNDDTGYFKFKPPAEAGLKKLQKRLREVATDCTPSKKRLGTKKRQ